MKNAIVRKLSSALRRRITSEQQVVYIMVELRKLLELESESDNFPALVFHSDWVVHSKLSKRPALVILDAFNKHVEYFTKLSQLKTGESIVEYDSMRHSVYPIVGLANFVLELTNVLQKYNLPTDLTQDATRWRAFLKHYGSVIRDCPLLCKAKNKPFIDEIFVEISSIRKRTREATGMEVRVRWKWKNKQTGGEEYVPMFF